MSPPSLLTAVGQQAIAAREALTPRILERIPRTVVQDKYLVAIHRSLSTEQPQVIPIVAPAGYGKSTILGDLYDQLTQAEIPWVGVILCSTVSVSSNFFSFLSSTYLAATFAPASPSPTDAEFAAPVNYQSSAIDGAFGQSLSGLSQSLTEVTRSLTTTAGKGVLLIDTLDLIVNREFVPAFNTLLRQLLEQGVTVVFTCRDHEYNDYLEPTRERLMGIAQRVNRYSVPDFTTAEIRQAAETFFRKLEPETSQRGHVFADNILALSADNCSLHDIIRNPLLLALLCDLFAKEENVPPDLTVSKLYQRYWNEKIAYSRVDQSDTALLALEKDSLCLTIARCLFEMSRDKLCESIYRDEIGIQFTKLVVSAYEDLLSEGVLERLPSRKIHFFHQTLLEYAIAYWLTRHSAQAQRQQWLERIKQSGATHAHTYWYPVVRQHLTIVETDDEFEALVQQLDLNNVAVFGTVAHAAASRDRPSVLLKLLPTALEFGDAHQGRLRQALESAPRQLADESWAAMLSLLEQGGHTTAANTAKMISLLLARWWQSWGDRLEDAMDAVARRVPVCEAHSGKVKDDRTFLLGWLLEHCLPLIQVEPRPNLLTALRKHYLLFGYPTCITVVQIHQMPGVAKIAQQELLARMMSVLMPNDESLETASTQFMTALLPVLLAERVTPWRSWADVLYAQYPKGWDIVQARAIGRYAVADRACLSGILDDLLSNNTGHFRRNFIALSEAIHAGGEAAIAQLLLNVDLQALEPNLFVTLMRFLREVGSTFSCASQERLAQWLKPFARSHVDSSLTVLNSLADGSLTARQLVVDLLPDRPPAEQTRYRTRLLRFLPIKQHPPLGQLDKDSQLFLIRLYREQATSNLLAFNRLLEACQYRNRDVALAASQGLDQWAIGRLSVSQGLPLLKSQFPGVRVKVLSAIVTLSNQGIQLTTAQMTEICTSLGQDDNQAVVRPLCELVATWVQHHKQVPLAVAEAVGDIPVRLESKKTFDGGTARVMISALKAIAQAEDLSVKTGSLSQWTHYLLTAINIVKIENSESEMIDLLSAINRLDESFLVQAVREDCPVLAQRRWLRK